MHPWFSRHWNGYWGSEAHQSAGTGPRSVQKLPFSITCCHIIILLNQVSIQLNDDSLIVSAAYMFLKWGKLNGNVKGLSTLEKAFSHITNVLPQVQANIWWVFPLGKKFVLCKKSMFEIFLWKNIQMRFLSCTMNNPFSAPAFNKPVLLLKEII